MRILIIGGSDAGISAALRSRELDSTAEITVLLEDSYPNYSICGLPFYLSGETPDWHALAHRTDFDGIHVKRNHRALSIQPNSHTVSVRAPEGQSGELAYDRLIIATGAVPIEPPLEGLRLPGVFPLHTIGDSFRIAKYLTETNPRSAIIVGSGYIGVEMADALSRRDIKVTMLGKSHSVLSSVDPELGSLVEEELRRHGVEVIDDTEVHVIQSSRAQLTVMGNNDLRKIADMLLVAVGVRPASDLAKAAGIETGEKSAIRVDRRMQTSAPNIYAAGDCAETWHRLLARYVYLPLGTTSHKQGRVAGENAIGGNRDFAGSLGTQVVKVFDKVIGRTGLRDDSARQAGFDAITSETTTLDHKAYYPGASELRIRITGDRTTGRLLGAQLIGEWRAEVSKRLDVFATALFHGMNIEELGDLDLSYTPPLSSPWDPVQIAAQAWMRAHR